MPGHFPEANPASATKKRSTRENSVTYEGSQVDRCVNNVSPFFRHPLIPKEKKMSQSSAIAYVKQFTLPTLTQGKTWSISFYAFDPVSGTLRRKRIRVSPKFSSRAARIRYARDLIERLSIELQQGWNPWVEADAGASAFTTWDDVEDLYRSSLSRMRAEGVLRDKTLRDYLSRLATFTTWNAEQPRPIFYAYQFDRKLLSRFVDWLWLDHGLSIRTRDNYVTWLRVLGGWLVSKDILPENPAEHVPMLGGKVKSQKNRTIIPADAMGRLRDWLRRNNPHFLLACYVLYYCLIRPNEMSFIQLKHISVSRGTVFIPADSSKNKKDGTVTLPDRVLKLMIELDTFSAADDDYLFSDGFRPGPRHRTGKQFTDYWNHYVRKNLHFPREWKFYSLKDTGITDLIRENTDLLSVRNQARHHSLLMTDIYTPRDIEQANDVIRHRDGSF